MDFTRFTHLSFDCYGTLVDWERGILDALRPLLAHHGAEVADAELVRLYARFEAEHEAGPYVRYREILHRVTASLGDAMGFEPSEEELDALPRSFAGWPPFPDTIDALVALAQRFGLVILSNVDDDLFAGTRERLGVRFTEVVTAEQVGSYKPNERNFRHMLERIGAPPERVLHVAQSLYHDHVPAKRLGFSTVWVNRPSACPDVGLAPPAEVTPDLVVPDLATLAQRAVGR